MPQRLWQAPAARIAANPKDFEARFALAAVLAWADLHIRLENAEKARTRILALLDRAQKMEEIIVLEKELRRLTEEIETMRAQLRGMDDQIAFSTITVEFRSNAPEIYGRVDREVSPFGWINQVGAEHALGR